MENYKYDIFLSYRREGGEDKARNIQLELEQYNLKVFLDYDSLYDNVFEDIILKCIEQTPIFMFVMTPNCLDRTVLEGDWIARELLFAIQHNKKIIPIEFKEYQFGEIPKNIPEQIYEVLSKTEHSELSTGQLFKKSIELLIDNRVANVFPERTIIKRTKTRDIRICTNADCIVKHFDKQLIIAHPYEGNIIHLPKGRHKLCFVLAKNNTIVQEKSYVVDDVSKSDYIDVDFQETEEDPLIRQNHIDFDIEGVKFRMLRVESGSFFLFPKDVKDRSTDKLTNTRITITKNYYIGETPVTQQLWEKIMGYNPSRHRNVNNPVEMVSWEECQKFIEKLNKLTTRTFRLPTEAEWAFAANGGNMCSRKNYSGSNCLQEIGWYIDNTDMPHVVKQKQPNELGIYDMCGNVYEWCSDWYGCISANAHLIDPVGPFCGLNKVKRGGSWRCLPIHCNLAHRGQSSPVFKEDNTGFRLVLGAYE